MTILVTGASGFVGGALVESLLYHKREIRALGRKQPKAAVEFFEGFIEGQFIPKIALEGVDCIVHLAGMAHQLKSAASGTLERFMDINCRLTAELATQAAESGVRRFIFISSIGVNGSNTSEDRPFTESSKVEPHSFYAISKYEAELALQAICGEKGMELVIIRPPLIYGRGAPGNFEVLMQLIKSGIPLPFGSVGNKRSFLGVDNLVDLIVSCIDHPRASNQLFLAADGEDFSTTEFFRELINATGSATTLFPVPVALLWLLATLLRKKVLAKSLLGSLQIDISKARDLLGWEPPVSAKEGLKGCFRDSFI